MASKEIIETDECLEFRKELTSAELKDYQHSKFELAETGRLKYPQGEKVEDGLFAIRICKGGNARFFYCYDDGTAIWILNGYEKKTQTIPLRELNRARQLKRKYDL